MNINTSQGPKTPEEALELLKKAKLPQGDLLGIFNQLIGYPEGKQVAEHIVANPARYSEKLRRIARQKSTDRPIGAKAINSGADLNQILQQCGVRAQVKITIRKDQSKSLARLLYFKDLEIQQFNKAGLMAVAISGEWERVSRTFNATLTMASKNSIPTVKALFEGVVEKIELVSTLTERIKAVIAPIPLSEEVKALLAANPNLFFDKSLFLSVCDQQRFESVMEAINKLPEDATMEDAMLAFRNNSSREEFLEYYIASFMAATA